MADPFRGVLLDMEQPNEFISFLVFDPPSWSRQVNYSEVEIRGRSEPHVFYSSTGPKIWSFELHLFAGDVGSARTVRQQELFIESLIMPDYGALPGQTSAVAKPPHRARIRIKQMLDVVGTLRDLRVDYLRPYEGVTGFPYIVKVGFTMHAQRLYGQEAPLGFADVRRMLSRGQGVQ